MLYKRSYWDLMKWILGPLVDDSDVQFLLHFLDGFFGLKEVSFSESDSNTRRFEIVVRPVIWRIVERRVAMAEGEEQLELKFRIFDGTDIGHRTYSASTNIATLKQRILSDWPQDKSVTPKSVNDMKLIHAGKVLDNGKTLAESMVHVGDLPSGVITMHVVIQPPVAKRKTDKNNADKQNPTLCSCSIL